MEGRGSAAVAGVPLVGGVGDALSAFAQGNHVVLVSAGGCALALSAQHATTERVALMIRHSTGVLSACMDHKTLEACGLQSSSSSSGMGPCLSVDFPGVAPGASAKGRAATLKAFCDVATNATNSEDSSAVFSKPGHTFVISVNEGGVLESMAPAEAAYDLCRLTRHASVGVVAEMMQEDGDPCGIEQAEAFAKEYGLCVLAVEQLCAHRRSLEKENAHSGPSGPVLEGESKMWVEDIEADCLIQFYRTARPKIEIVTIVKGDVKDMEAVPARVHSECFTGDVLMSKRCDCGQQLHRFLDILNAEARGVLLYIRGHEGRGIGLANKLRAYHLQDKGVDTVDANLKLGLPVDTRTYDDALAVFKQLGIKSIRLFTNNPEKIGALKPITQEVSALASVPGEHNLMYLNTKRERLNHRTVLETFKLPTPKLDMSKTKIGVVYTTWNQYYVDELKKSAETELKRSGVRTLTMAVPGACELISGARAIIRQAKPDAVIVLGVLIRGSSDVYDAMCTACMTGLTELNASQDVPIILGLLMCHNENQANERTHGSSNPAKAWAETALHMASLKFQIDDEKVFQRAYS